MICQFVAFGRFGAASHDTVAYTLLLYRFFCPTWLHDSQKHQFYLRKTYDSWNKRSFAMYYLLLSFGSRFGSLWTPCPPLWALLGSLWGCFCPVSALCRLLSDSFRLVWAPFELLRGLLGLAFAPWPLTFSMFDVVCLLFWIIPIRFAWFFCSCIVSVSL